MRSTFGAQASERWTGTTWRNTLYLLSVGNSRSRQYCESGRLSSCEEDVRTKDPFCALLDQPLRQQSVKRRYYYL